MTRAHAIHAARVYIEQARHFRQRAIGGSFAFTLLRWAADARRDAQRCKEPEQRQMFGDAA